MKKFLLSAFALAVAFSAAAFNMAPKGPMMKLDNMNIKKAPKELSKLVREQKLATLRGGAKVNQPTNISDLVGGYSWTYNYATALPANGSTDPTVAGTETLDVVIYDANDVDSTCMIAGMFETPLTATLDTETWSGVYDLTLKIPTDPAQPIYYSSSYGVCNLGAIFYFSGNTNYQAGWYLDDGVYAAFEDGKIVLLDDYMVYLIAEGQYAGYNLTFYFCPYSEMTDKPANNGVMTYADADLGTMASAVAITEDANYVVTVNNFNGLGNPAHFNLAADKTWTADADVIYSEVVSADTTLNYVLAGYDPEADQLSQLAGNGTETALTFGSHWTAFDATYNYWMGDLEPATITYINGTFVYPSANPDVYILGEVGDQTWAPNAGVQMAYGEETGLYTAEIECKDADNNGYDYFSFTTQLAENADDWDGIASYRFGAVSEGDFLVTDELLGQELSLEAGGDAYKVLKGKYNLTLDYANMKLIIEKVAEPFTLGDVNGDGDVNVMDITALIDIIMNDITDNPRADVNGDANIDVMDITALIDIIMGS